MAQLTYNNATKYRHLGNEDQPIEGEETIRDTLIQKLSQKQLSTVVDLEKAKIGKCFVQSSNQEPITAKFSGLLALGDFCEARNEVEIQESLKSCGLTDAEVDILLNKTVSGSSNEFLRASLDAIDIKLTKRQKELDNSGSHDTIEKFSDSLPLSRYEYEEECKNAPSSNMADKLTQCLVHVEPNVNPLYASDHPIHQLPILVKELFPPRASVLQRKKKRKRSTVKNVAEEEDTKLKKNTLWDVRKVCTTEIKSGRQVSTNETAICKRTDIGCIQKPFVYTVASESRKTDYSQPFVLSLKPQDLLSKDEIRHNCAGFSILKEQFSTYEPGVPSSVLYIKNLPFGLAPTILASIFGNFEPLSGPKITYRLLKGKMRGQAFVTMKGPEVASEALSLCHGYYIDNKPMIISFGNKKQNA